MMIESTAFMGGVLGHHRCYILAMVGLTIDDMFFATVGRLVFFIKKLGLVWAFVS
jgi:hypothetical protein